MSARKTADALDLPRLETQIGKILNGLNFAVREKGYVTATVDMSVWSYAGGDRLWYFKAANRGHGINLVSVSKGDLKEAVVAIIDLIDELPLAPADLSQEAYKALVDGLDRIMRQNGRAVPRGELDRVVNASIAPASVPIPEEAA